MAQNWNASIVELREGLDKLETQLNTLINLKKRLEYINKIKAEIEDLQRIVEANKGLTTQKGATGTPNSTLNERIANVNREYAKALDDVATATNKADVAQARYQLRIDNLSDAIDIYYRKNQDFIAQNPELVSGLTALAKALELARTEGNVGDASQNFKRFKIEVNEAQQAVKDLAKEEEAAAQASIKAENEALRIREKAEKEDEKRRQQRLRDAKVYYEEQVKNLALIEKEREKDRQAAIKSYKEIAKEQEREQKRIQDNLKAQALAAASEATYYATTIKNKVIDIDSINKSYEVFTIEQNSLINQLDKEVSKIDSYEYVDYHMKGFNKLLLNSFKYIGLLLLNPFKGIFPSLAVESLITRDVVKNLYNRLQWEEERKIVYHAVDYSSVITNSIDEMDRISNIIDVSLADVLSLKNEYCKKFKRYQGDFVQYNEVIKKINKLENKLLGNKIKVEILKERVLVQKRENDKKMKLVNKMNNQGNKNF